MATLKIINDTTLEKSVKAIEWLINHGYISIEN